MCYNRAMGLFGSSGRFSREEFRKARYKLRADGSFSNHELDEIENVFRGDLHESGSSAGISAEEMKKGIDYLKRHPENHHLSHEEIEKLEQTLKRYL